MQPFALLFLHYFEIFIALWCHDHDSKSSQVSLRYNVHINKATPQVLAFHEFFRPTVTIHAITRSGNSYILK